MTLNYSTPAVNPRLGSSFAIFASVYICLVLMLIIFEQLGLSSFSIDQWIVITPLRFYIAIGFVIAMLTIAAAAVTGYFLWEAGIETMSEI